ncbi:hypothetical protein N7522_012048 [Penicillium canescens]|uniref:Uncharacterized protein n=1 Tax=Penicillium canescens TaxID=5083 RepID=A0AAD6I0R7_PENCN|nr:uncharacterized protein N7446_013901 [Penicillium canescens]KAJ5984852.1 hypothetical protein N7522_012048 [Penicillium canescens]KAJ6023536.1 hypothetical protein N7460_013931 [Penicillium canescens]KAJ6025187.1 hypothetical protein N7444_012866 [Penicillium canescens]KAJ6042835.1 hypothetical protein N7446_013901 [Penicillium canescens]
MLIGRNYRKRQVVVTLSVGGMIELLLLCFQLWCFDLLVVSDDSILRQYPKLQLSGVSDSTHDLKLSIPYCTIRGWGSHSENIEAMRIVLRLK